MEEIFSQYPWIIGLILLWTLPWKAAALWRSARRGHLGWFLTLIILNTLAILDIIYIFFFSGLKKENVKNDNLQQESRQARMQRLRMEQNKLDRAEFPLENELGTEKEIQEVGIKKRSNFI